MAKIVLMVLIVMASLPVARAQLTDSNGNKYESRVPELLQKLKAIEINAHPLFEDNFNSAVKALENVIEEEKLFCSGEAANKDGWVVPKEQRQLCFRQLKNHYLNFTETVFDQKKKYLQVLHQRQLENLSEIQKKLKADIEKSF
jgi:hypothetical protein